MWNEKKCIKKFFFQYNFLQFQFNIYSDSLFCLNFNKNYYLYSENICKSIKEIMKIKPDKRKQFKKKIYI